jgi:hypothetical protein
MSRRFIYTSTTTRPLPNQSFTWAWKSYVTVVLVLCLRSARLQDSSLFPIQVLHRSRLTRIVGRPPFPVAMMLRLIPCEPSDTTRRMWMLLAQYPSTLDGIVHHIPHRQCTTDPDLWWRDTHTHDATRHSPVLYPSWYGHSDHGYSTHYFPPHLAYGTHQTQGLVSSHIYYAPGFPRYDR